MIIAAYAGCGKTTLARKYPEKCIEVASMPYARILPIVREETTGNLEGEKAAEYHINNPIYPYNMIADILELEKEYKYVIVPSARSIIDILQNEYFRSIILCYPQDGLEEEYRQRYLKRGNTDGFCQIFVDKMQDFLKVLKENKKAYHFTLKSGECLADKFDEFEAICKAHADNILEQEKLTDLRNAIQEQKKNVWLDIDLFMDRVFYQVRDIDDLEERQFIYDFGKRLYNLVGMPSISSFNFDIQEKAKQLGISVKSASRMDLMSALEKQEERLIDKIL